MSTTLEPAADRSPRRVVGSDAGGISIPVSAATWAGFRAWAKSDAFPRRGKVAYLGEEIFVDMSPERIGSHNALKTELFRVLSQLVRAESLGYFFSDGVLVSHEAAGVSNEPDAVFASYEAVRSGRVVFDPTADGRDWIELVGSPDFVAEIVSPSSVGKDVRQLRARYHAAGIPEHWLLDARGDEIVFQLLRHTPTGYAAAEPRGGWLPSPVFGREFRLDRVPDPIGLWQYTLHTRPTGAA